MTDSNEREDLARKQEQNQRDRLVEIKRWVAYVQSTDPDVWGDQLNTLVEAQLDAARGAAVSPEQYRRVTEAGKAYRDESGDDH